MLPVDLSAVRRAYTALFKLKTSIFENSLVNALVTLAGNLQMELPTRKDKDNHDDIVNVLLIVFEIPGLGMYVFSIMCVNIIHLLSIVTLMPLPVLVISIICTRAN